MAIGLNRDENMRGLVSSAMFFYFFSLRKIEIYESSLIREGCVPI